MKAVRTMTLYNVCTCGCFVLYFFMLHMSVYLWFAERSASICLTRPFVLLFSIRDLKTAVGTWKGDGEGILSGKKGTKFINQCFYWLYNNLCICWHKWSVIQGVFIFSDDFHTEYGLIFLDVSWSMSAMLLRLCAHGLNLLSVSQSFLLFLFFFLGPEQIQGSLRNQVLQSESCSMEQKSIIAK